MSEIESLKNENAKLKEELSVINKNVTKLMQEGHDFYASALAQSLSVDQNSHIRDFGCSARMAKTFILDQHELDFRERLNTSSYVNVSFEPEEEEVALQGLRINLADQTVYPQSYKMHNDCVNLIARLWHCPTPHHFEDPNVPADEKVFNGAGCVGSTEACLLAGLCLKFRWRTWYMKKYGKTEAEVFGIRPVMIITSMFQAAWEKFFKYMDCDPVFIIPDSKKWVMDVKELENQLRKEEIGSRCIGIVGVMGNHYSGHYDPIWEIDEMLTKLNAELGYQIGVHVDGASGGFIAPFQDYLPPWDFRCENVLSISASGHKFGESCCGTGWVVWRERNNLSEHIAISVSYLGGNADSYTLNFSRPASGVYVQLYKFLRLGDEGYRQLEQNMMSTAKMLRDFLKTFRKDGKPLFRMLDAGDTGCLPVVTAQLNPDLKLGYDDIDLQHSMAEEHWYVCGYRMQFHHPLTEDSEHLVKDMSRNQTMFRIVVKSNLTLELCRHLKIAFTKVVGELDKMKAGYIEQHPSRLNRKQSQLVGSVIC